MSEVKTGDQYEEMAKWIHGEINSEACGNRCQTCELISEKLRSVERRTAEECGIICQQNPNHHQGANAIRERFHLEGL